MVCNLEGRVVGAVLEGGVGGENGGNVEDDGGLFKGERVLLCGFMGKGIEPVKCVNRYPRGYIPVGSE